MMCLLSTSSLASWLEVHGDSAPAEVRLLWVPVEAWPADVAAIDILRAPCDGAGVRSGPWVRTTLKPIKPSISTERVWSDVHYEDVAQSLLRADLMSRLANGTINFDDDAAFLAFLTTISGEEMINAVRANLLHEENAVWVFGFGTTRARPLTQAGQLYGFFEVSASGVRSAEPIGTFHDLYVPNDDPRLAVTPNFATVHPTGVRLTWSFPASLYDELDLRPFGVSRDVIGPGGDKEVVELGHPVIERVGDMLECSFYDHLADQEAPYTYHVTTRSFVARDRRTTSTDYDPETVREQEARVLPLEAPVLTEAKQLQNGDLAVNWEFDMAHEKYIQGFELHRREGAREAFKAIRADLSPTTRHTLDTSEKIVGNTYSYKVVALRKSDRMPYSSKIVPVLISDLREPPAPQDLKATIEVQEGKRFAVLTWAAPAADDTVTHQWLIDSDESHPGEVVRQAGIEPLSAPIYRYPIGTVEARPYTFRVTAISKASIESPPSEVKIDTPGKYLPNVVFERFELIDSGRRLRLHWRFPTLENVTGFQLYINGKAVTASPLLGPDARMWETERLERGSEHRYNVQAVSEGGLRSYLGKDWSYRMPAGAGLPVKPTKLKVRSEPALQRLRVFWARITDGLTHVYTVRVKPPGEDWRDAGTVKGTAPPLWIQTDVDSPGSWEFEVKGTTIHGLNGPAATVSHVVLATKPVTEAPPKADVPPEDPEPETPWLLWAVVGLFLLLGAGTWWWRRKA
ncbi:MAG: hypothetical protein ACPGU1_04370 [Myxococcota bacterium]